MITAGVILSAPVGAGSFCGSHCLKLPGSCVRRLKAGTAFSPGFLPVYAGVLIMGGETSAGAAASGFFLTLLCLLAQALTAFVPPILECFLALSMACCITEQSCLGNLCKAAGTLLQKGLSLTGKLLAALLGFQRISAAQLDRTALRTGQFLTGTIPIVGQSLSDASEAVLAGIQLLKSGLGMAAILILLAEFLPLYLGMLAHLGCIVLCGTLCSLTGNNRGQALLACFASAVRCMMACIALFFGLAVTGTALLFMLGAFDADIEKRSCGLLHCLYLRRAAGPAHRKQLGPAVHKSRGWTIYFSGAFTGHPSAPNRSSVLFCAGSFARIHGHAGRCHSG